jgi:hypothetical protein
MGQHSARRSGGAVSSVAGRGLFTATAAVALLGGGTSMAVAGEASSSGGHDGESASSSHHESEDCRIPVVDDATHSGEATVNGVTGNAAAPVFEAAAQATQPVHDVVCEPADEIVGGLLGGSGDAGEDEESAASTDTQAASSDAGQASSPDSEDTGTSSGGSTDGSGVPMELPIQ